MKSSVDARDGRIASASGAIAVGAMGFAVVSLLGFSAWALAGIWLHARIGEGGIFAACAIVFLGASGLLLHPLVNGPNRLARFYAVFVPAFLAYAAAWSAAWFIFQFGPGEWLGSLAGSVAFVAVARWRLGGRGPFLKTCVVVFAAHSLGYFLGAKAMNWLAPPGHLGPPSQPHAHFPLLAKLAWGAVYGVGFGSGIGYTFFVFQTPKPAAAVNEVPAS